MTSNPTLRLLLLGFSLGASLIAATPEPAAADSPPPAAIFTALCQALRDHYPMLELVGWQEEWVRDIGRRIEAAPDRERAFALMDELVCRLNDYHTRLSWPGQPRLAGPSIQVEPVLVTGGGGPRGLWDVRPPRELPPLENIVLAVVDAPPESGARIGDVVLAVDGITVPIALAEAWRHSVGSSAAGKLRGAAHRILQGPPATPVALRVRRTGPGGPEVELTLSLARNRAREADQLSIREVAGVPVIRIHHWGQERREEFIARFDADLARWRQSPGLIIDVRANGGGSDQLADQVVGRFLTEPIVSSIFFERHARQTTYARQVMTASPRGPWRYEGRVAVLTDEGCMSACEHFVSGMIEAGAAACGTPTSGAGGWIRSLDLPGGVRLRVSRTYPLHTGGVPSPQLGIAPHLWAPRTLADLRRGTDTALAAALQWVQGTTPLPTRLQPVAPLRQ